MIKKVMTIGFLCLIIRAAMPIAFHPLLHKQEFHYIIITTQCCFYNKQFCNVRTLHNIRFHFVG